MMRGCLYCYNGNMDKAMELFNGCYPDIRLVYPQRVRHRRLAGKTYFDEIAPMLPGDMFFETDHDLLKEKLKRTNSVLRLLTYTDDEWELHGADDHFAKMMFNLEGGLVFPRPITTTIGEYALSKAS